MNLPIDASRMNWFVYRLQTANNDDDDDDVGLVPNRLLVFENCCWFRLWQMAVCLIRSSVFVFMFAHFCPVLLQNKSEMRTEKMRSLCQRIKKESWKKLILHLFYCLWWVPLSLPEWMKKQSERAPNSLAKARKSSKMKHTRKTDCGCFVISAHSPK